MKNNNSNTSRQTRIMDISVAGKELSEEHLHLVGGGAPVGAGGGGGVYKITTHRTTYAPTCTSYGRFGCGSSTTDSVDSSTDTLMA